VRLIGSIDAAGRRAVGYRWFNSLPAAQAAQCLVDAGMGPDPAAGLARRRPRAEGWPGAMPGTAASYQALITMLEGKPGLC
jgi:allantoicase